MNLADFCLPWRFVVDVEFVLEFSHCENVGSATGLHELHNASVFRVEVCRMRELNPTDRLVLCSGEQI
jgi:hypothetical protein